MPGNPLTARVFANRVWHWVFGAGLVTTPDDFGHLGDQPSHPELLDYLAAEFVANGWSTQKLVRALVTSEAFQQSNEVAGRAGDVDPNNRLLHHYQPRRLDAESIRDSLLAVSGRLDQRLFGQPIDPHRANEDPEKRLYAGPVGWGWAALGVREDDDHGAAEISGDVQSAESEDSDGSARCDDGSRAGVGAIE